MQQTRSAQVFQALKGIDKLLQIVPVDGAEIAEAQRLEQGAAAPPHQVGLGVDDALLHPVARFALSQRVPDFVLEPVVERVCGYLQEVVVQAANVLVDGDVVVVQDNEDIGLGRTGVVQAFPGQAAGEGAVADDCDGLFPAAGEMRRLRKAQRGGDGRGRMSGAEGIVWALVPLGETTDAVPRAVFPEQFPPTGNNLMGVCLMAYVKDDFILGGVEDSMERHDEFHRTQTGAQVAGIHGAAFHHVLTDFRTELHTLLRGQFFHVLRRIHLIEQFIHSAQRYYLFSGWANPV